MSRKRIYFLCTGNSCRSQMAEGWARHLGGERIEVQSAGIEAHGLNPRAVQVMREVGIDISHHRSKLIDPDFLEQADYVITLCGDANDRCPVTPPHVKRLHWGFPDPAKATGSEEEILNQFRQVRDAIGARIRSFLDRELS
ncbi:arsenate reductase (thioredoxin) [Alicyclobacillus mali]|uniref:Arsenate reductase n=1 Tax=Alicyclobacillus mali (ex Roth et al. 2021) TaxID=1123961 RepID=A0ABS0F4K9_9BACL|nr:arsenate reductase (thioredoxin) [Alicyclobacillus mali (ex Roth et al. 2021)]MBF8378209.1 arsenate reductase (thioredoxin) [Alicyclobacillus mali (ex Roth et al. 2021)]MCL6487529.1 arsenate reductase (thioredoxin) [Alicyclobacillus mali (ex Roth et al. 2021)]